MQSGYDYPHKKYRISTICIFAVSDVLVETHSGRLIQVRVMEGKGPRYSPSAPGVGESRPPKSNYSVVFFHGFHSCNVTLQLPSLRRHTIASFFMKLWLIRRERFGYASHHVRPYPLFPAQRRLCLRATRDGADLAATGDGTDGITIGLEVITPPID